MILIIDFSSKISKNIDESYPIKQMKQIGFRLIEIIQIYFIIWRYSKRIQRHMFVGSSLSEMWIFQSTTKYMWNHSSNMSIFASEYLFFTTFSLTHTLFCHFILWIFNAPLYFVLRLFIVLRDEKK